MKARFALWAAVVLLAGCGTALVDGLPHKPDVPESGSATKAAPNKDAKAEDAGKADSAGHEKGSAGNGKDEGKKQEEKKEEGKAEEEPKGHVNVRCVPAQKRTFADTVDGLGRTEALPESLGSLTATVEGHVHKLLVTLGQTVKADQPILELDTTLIKTTLAEKKATLDSLKAALKLLKSLPRPEEAAPAKLAVEQAKVGIEHANDIVDRLRPLVSSPTQGASRAQLIDAQHALKQANLQRDTAEAQLNHLMLPPRPEAVEEAQAKIAIAEQAVANTEATLHLHTLRAPIGGVVDSLNCHPGQTLTVGTPVGEIVDTRRLFVTVYFPTRSARYIQVGQPAHIDLADGDRHDAESKDKKENELNGQVAFVGRVADMQTGNYPVRILVDNVSGRLRVGQVVKTTVTLRTDESTIAVPETALFDQGEGPLLAVIREEKIKLLHPELGTSQGGFVAVHKTDLKDGEMVVIEGAYNVPEGTSATIETAAPAKEKDTEKDEAKPEADAKAAPHAKEAEPAKGEATKTERTKGESTKSEPAAKAGEHK